MYLVRMRAGRSILLLVVGLTLVACTRGNIENRADPAGPSGADAVALAPYAQRFASLLASFDVARDTFEAASAALRPGATAGDFVLIARPFADAVANADVELRQVTWPPVARNDIKAQLAADTSLRAELLGTLDDTLIASVWRQQIISAANKVGSVARRVSIELGVRPPSG